MLPIARDLQAMVINTYRNNRTGLGGSTRRLHHLIMILLMGAKLDSTGAKV